MEKKENDCITVEIQQSQNASKGAESTQIGVQNNYNGLTPEQACNMALNLFRENFPVLQQEAVKLANERVEAYIRDLILELTKSGITDYGFLRDPDIQNALLESERGYALKGGDELRATLVKLLSNRFCENADSILATVLDEAIKTAPLLNERQKDLLALRFIIGETKRNNLRSVGELIQYLRSLAKAFSDLDSLTRTDFRHLDYCKCCHELIGKEFGCSVAITYKDLLPLVAPSPDDFFESEQVQINIDGRVLNITSYLQEKCPELGTLIEAYDNGICHVMITSVGLVIGAIHAEIKMSNHYNLSIWIN